VLRHDPTDVDWLGRDRFILSAGHSSLTQYVELYLGGFGLELDDLKALRTWGSLTPGHPEYGHTKGVEITTGPLGQGLASAVGFAYAARYERGLFDPEAAPGTSPFDHFVYVVAGDGDLQEGVTSGRFSVRCMCASMSRSRYMLNAAAEPALSEPPMTVASTSHRFGRPPCARNITGTVETSRSSRTRGLVSVT
jgi:hypothetical protein